MSPVYQTNMGQQRCVAGVVLSSSQASTGMLVLSLLCQLRIMLPLAAEREPPHRAYTATGLGMA